MQEFFTSKNIFHRLFHLSLQLHHFGVFLSFLQLIKLLNIQKYFRCEQRFYSKDKSQEIYCNAWFEKSFLDALKKRQP
jgi:hypothetical protein